MEATFFAIAILCCVALWAKKHSGFKYPAIIYQLEIEKGRDPRSYWRARYSAIRYCPADVAEKVAPIGTEVTIIKRSHFQGAGNIQGNPFVLVLYANPSHYLEIAASFDEALWLSSTLGWHYVVRTPRIF